MNRYVSLLNLSAPLLAGIEESLAREGTHGLTDVEMALRAGDAQLWVSDDGLGAAVTEINNYPSGAKRARIWLSAGRLESIISMDADFADLARELGCDSVELLGRQGWARALKEHGWTPHSITMMKRL